MKCSAIQEKISRMLDGELDPAAERAIRAHLEICEECRSVKEQWEACSALTRTQPIPAIPTPEAAWSDVQRALRQQKMENRDKGRAWAFIPKIQWAGFAAMLLVLVVGLLLIARTKTLKDSSLAHIPSTDVLHVETGMAGTAPMVYEDRASGWMVIWVVPSEKEVKRADS